MADSKVQINLGDFSFSAEGDKAWVESQLNAVMGRIPGLVSAPASAPAAPAKVKAAPAPAPTPAPAKPAAKKAVATAPPVVKKTVKKSSDPLANYLVEKNADKNQVRKFLAVAVYLHSQGEAKLSTPLVSGKMREAGVGTLSNASDCLNKNAKKNFAIKQGKEFILTDAGIQSIVSGGK